jgi:hypothetical protein
LPRPRSRIAPPLIRGRPANCWAKSSRRGFALCQPYPEPRAQPSHRIHAAATAIGLSHRPRSRIGGRSASVSVRLRCRAAFPGCTAARCGHGGNSYDFHRHPLGRTRIYASKLPERPVCSKDRHASLRRFTRRRSDAFSIVASAELQRPIDVIVGFGPESHFQLHVRQAACC